MPGFKPLHDKVLIKPDDALTVTKGGILIPDQGQEKPHRGTVIAIGSGRIAEDGTIRPLDVKKGDKVLYGKYNGSEIEIEGVKHMILTESEIIGLFEG